MEFDIVLALCQPRFKLSVRIISECIALIIKEYAYGKLGNAKICHEFLFYQKSYHDDLSMNSLEKAFMFDKLHPNTLICTNFDDESVNFIEANYQQMDKHFDKKLSVQYMALNWHKVMIDFKIRDHVLIQYKKQLCALLLASDKNGIFLLLVKSTGKGKIIYSQNIVNNPLIEPLYKQLYFIKVWKQIYSPNKPGSIFVAQYDNFSDTNSTHIIVTKVKVMNMTMIKYIKHWVFDIEPVIQRQYEKKSKLINALFKNYKRCLFKMVKNDKNNEVELWICAAKKQQFLILYESGKAKKERLIQVKFMGKSNHSNGSDMELQSINDLRIECFYIKHGMIVFGASKNYGIIDSDGNIVCCYCITCFDNESHALTQFMESFDDKNGHDIDAKTEKKDIKRFCCTFSNDRTMLYCLSKQHTSYHSESYTFVTGHWMSDDVDVEHYVCKKHMWYEMYQIDLKQLIY